MLAALTNESDALHADPAKVAEWVVAQPLPQEASAGLVVHTASVPAPSRRSTSRRHAGAAGFSTSAGAPARSIESSSEERAQPGRVHLAQHARAASSLGKKQNRTESNSDLIISNVQ